MKNKTVRSPRIGQAQWGESTMGISSLRTRQMGPQKLTVRSCLGRNRGPGTQRSRDRAHLAQARTRARDAYSNVLDALLQSIIPEAIVDPEANKLQGWLGPKQVLSRHV